MNMGSLAETYLSAYGWKLYGVIYLVFWASKIMLYPLARFGFDVLIEFASKGGDSKIPLREVSIRFIIMVSVFILGAIPMVKYNASAAVIEMPGCGTKEVGSQKAAYDKRFGDNAYVPLLPYLAMLVGSGVNMAILQSMPCVTDLLQANQISNNLAMVNNTDGRALKEEASAFGAQCYAPASTYSDAQTASNDPLRAMVMKQLKYHYYPLTNEVAYYGGYGGASTIEVSDIKKGADYLGSDYYNKVFYTDEACHNFKPKAQGGLKAADLQKAWNDMCLGIRNTRVITQYAQASTPSGTNSIDQQNKGVDTVKCGDWWNGSNGQDGLHDRLAYSGFESSFAQFVNSLSAGGNGSNKEAMTGEQISLNLYEKDPEGYTRGIYNKLSDVQKEKLVQNMNDVALDREDHSVLSDGQKAVMVGGGLVSFITSRGGTIGDLTKIAMTTAITKAAVTLAHPVLLMLIYALWLLYLVMGEFKGMTLIKGLLMIFVIKFCTSVFAIADRLSDELVLLLVPHFSDNLWTVIKSSPDVAIIYMVGTLMYLAVPGIMMYLVAMAGGPAEARSLSKDGASSSRQIGNDGGGMAGRGAGSAAGSLEKSAVSGAKKISGR